MDFGLVAVGVNGELAYLIRYYFVIMALDAIFAAQTAITKKYLICLHHPEVVLVSEIISIPTSLAYFYFFYHWFGPIGPLWGTVAQ